MIARVLLVLFLSLTAVSLYFIWDYSTFLHSPAGPATEQLVYEVKPGMGFYQVASELATKGIIKDEFKFRLFARFSRKAQKLRVGEYALSAGLTPAAVLEILTSGKSVEHAITFHEGLNMYEMATHLEQKGLGSKEEFLRLCHDKALIKELLGEDLYSLEGYLFPETYNLTKFTGAAGLVRMMVKNFMVVYSEVIAGVSTNWKRHQVVTLASIIEKETGAPEERFLISSVFHNRLKKSMRLQSDPTIIYGILDATKTMPTNIRRQDILTPTRYNTYAIQGLPFGPIANPGREAMQAALRPATSEYLYFVSRNDGTHVFTSAYKDHQAAVRKFQLDRKAREGKSWRDLNKRANTQGTSGAKKK